MIDRIHELVGAEAVVSRRHIHLQSQHIRGRKLLARFEHPINAIRPPRRFPLRADRILVAVRSDAPVGGRQNSRRRIVNVRHLVERDPAFPLVRIVAAAHRQAAIARRADGHSPRRLITDVTIHIAVHYVLSGRAESRERFAKLIPILGRVHVEEHQAHAVLQGPAQGDLARLARKQFRDDWPMARAHYIHNYVRLAFDVNRLLPMLRINPSLCSFVLALRIELLDEVVLHRRPDVGESPADALVVADNHERNSRQRNAGHIEIAAGRFQVRLKPEVRHLVVEVHIVRQQRLARNRVLTGNDPVVRPWPERIGLFQSESRSEGRRRR